MTAIKNSYTSPLPNGNNKPSTEQSIRVLCVDDEPRFLETAKQFLELDNFTVKTASSVDDALQKMAEQELDAIVSDYMMHGKDGLDFLKELRESQNNIPFILFTGKGREEVAVKALNLGADRYFNKFGHPETVYGELSHSIRQAVAQRRAEQEIRKNEQQLRAIISSSPDGIVSVDMNGVVTSVNQAILDRTGFPESGPRVRFFCPARRAGATCDRPEKRIRSGRPRTPGS